MKTISSIAELIIIVLCCIIIVLPEIAYSLMLRARDEAIDMVGEL